MDTRTSVRKNPSRETCEQVIRRILLVELSEHGSNLHFKQASDFMNYFESLYPASDSLTKQVQRAIKSLNMPRDEHGYYIPNKTPLQLAQEKELRNLFHQTNPSINDLKDCEPLFLKLEDPFCDYAIHLIQSSKTFQESYEAIVRSPGGILFYTKNKNELLELLNNFI